jgi:prephenate dehydratase
MKLSYLGPPNTYSEKAAQMVAAQIKADVEVVPMSSVEAVARSLISESSDRAAFGVMPYYNYLEGLVQECVDLVYEYRLNMVGAQRVPIELCLGTHPDNTEFENVYSHAKALAQCSEYLWQHFPKCHEVAVSSTAESAAIVKENKSGLSIASLEALNYHGLKIIAQNIGNKRHGRVNFTDFYLLSRGEDENYDETRQYLTMIAITPQVDRSGLLAEILGQVAYHELNNAKIHSRPAIDEVSMDVEPQMFYLELMAHRNDPDFIRCIDSLRYRLTPKGKDTEVVRVLGSYIRPRMPDEE